MTRPKLIDSELIDIVKDSLLDLCRQDTCHNPPRTHARTEVASN